MEKEPGNYQKYFHPGQRARVELSLEGERSFNDGAVVTSVGENRVGLRLSRDQFPEGVLLHSQAHLVVRVGMGGSGFSCKAVVVEEPSAGDDLLIEFIDRVVSADSREYFRLDTEMPVTLFNVTAGSAEESSHGGLRLVGELRLPQIVNISGGGLRTETEMAMTVDDIVYTTFHLPLPERKVIPVVTQVVHSSLVQRGDKQVVSAGLRYMHINERDRDAIVAFVCNEEMRLIRQRRKDFYSLS